MARVLVSESNLTNIANAIRTKNCTNNTYTPAQMSPAILAIPTGGGSAIWNINITQSANQTISVTTSISKSGSSSYTIGASDTPNVVASVTPDYGYIAGTASVQQSGTTFNISASAATPETTTDVVKNYSNVVATIDGNYFRISSIGNNSDGWWMPGGVNITQYYESIALESFGSYSNHVAYTFTGTLTLDGHELNFNATNWESGSYLQCTNNANLSSFKTYYQSLGNGSHTFSTVTLRLTNVIETYVIQYAFSSSMDQSAMPSTIYWSQVVNDANYQLNNTVPSKEYLNNGATTTVWTPASPSSTVLTDSSNNCKWTFSGYSPASVGGDTINNAGREYVISYSWVATPL